MISILNYLHPIDHIDTYFLVLYYVHERNCPSSLTMPVDTGNSNLQKVQFTACDVFCASDRSEDGNITRGIGFNGFRTRACAPLWTALSHDKTYVFQYTINTHCWKFTGKKRKQISLIKSRQQSAFTGSWYHKNHSTKHGFTSSRNISVVQFN